MVDPARRPTPIDRGSDNRLGVLEFEIDVENAKGVIGTPDRLLNAIRKELLETIDQTLDRLAADRPDIAIDHLTIDLGHFQEPVNWADVRKVLRQTLASAIGPYLRLPRDRRTGADNQSPSDAARPIETPRSFEAKPKGREQDAGSDRAPSPEIQRGNDTSLRDSQNSPDWDIGKDALMGSDPQAEPSLDAFSRKSSPSGSNEDQDSRPTRAEPHQQEPERKTPGSDKTGTPADDEHSNGKNQDASPAEATARFTSSEPSTDAKRHRESPGRQDSGDAPETELFGPQKRTTDARDPIDRATNNNQTEAQTAKPEDGQRRPQQEADRISVAPDQIRAPNDGEDAKKDPMPRKTPDPGVLQALRNIIDASVPSRPAPTRGSKRAASAFRSALTSAAGKLATQDTTAFVAALVSLRREEREKFLVDVLGLSSATSDAAAVEHLLRLAKSLVGTQRETTPTPLLETQDAPTNLALRRESLSEYESRIDRISDALARLSALPADRGWDTTHQRINDFASRLAGLTGTVAETTSADTTEQPSQAKDDVRVLIDWRVSKDGQAFLSDVRSHFDGDETRVIAALARLDKPVIEDLLKRASRSHGPLSDSIDKLIADAAVSREGLARMAADLLLERSIDIAAARSLPPLRPRAADHTSDTALHALVEDLRPSPPSAETGDIAPIHEALARSVDKTRHSLFELIHSVCVDLIEDDPKQAVPISKSDRFWALALAHSVTTLVAEPGAVLPSDTQSQLSRIFDALWPDPQTRASTLRMMIARLGHAPADKTSATGPALRHHARKTLEDLLYENQSLNTGVEQDAERHPARAQAESMRQTSARLTNRAGLVLFHPFLPMLFDRLGIRTTHDEIDPRDTPRALSLLGCLANANTPRDEAADPAELVLLGWRNDTAGPRRGEPTKDDLAMVMALLDAVITRWSKLGKTTPEGLQETFVRRNGLILPRDGGGYRLSVAEGPFDMLMDAMPWPLSPISLPWMPAPLHVDWRGQND